MLAGALWSTQSVKLKNLGDVFVAGTQEDVEERKKKQRKRQPWEVDDEPEEASSEEEEDPLSDGPGRRNLGSLEAVARSCAVLSRVMRGRVSKDRPSLSA